MDWKSAGILIYDPYYAKIICGSTRKRYQGFGGKKCGRDKQPLDTAVRQFVRETTYRRMENGDYMPSQDPNLPKPEFTLDFGDSYTCFVYTYSTYNAFSKRLIEEGFPVPKTPKDFFAKKGKTKSYSPSWRIEKEIPRLDHDYVVEMSYREDNLERLKDRMFYYFYRDLNLLKLLTLDHFLTEMSVKSKKSNGKTIEYFFDTRRFNSSYKAVIGDDIIGIEITNFQCKDTVNIDTEEQWKMLCERYIDIVQSEV